MWENGGRICEINSRPGLRAHLVPGAGKARDVLTPIIDMLFPHGHPARIPIVAITGTGDTRTTAHLVAHLLSSGGHHVGLSAGRRVYIGGRRLGKIRLALPAATRLILLDPEVDVAVLEVRPKDVLRHGLGCDAVSVVAVVKDPAPRKGRSEAALPAQIVDAIRVLARSAREVIYVDETDPCAAAIERDGGGAELCRVAGAGGTRAAAQSAFHAVLAACSLGMQPGDVYRSLRSFRPPPPAKAKKQKRRQGLRRAKAS
jgi:hypothetical protein